MKGISDAVLSFCFVVVVLFASGCEQEYLPAGKSPERELVIEGHIEAGENPLPAYVILTHTVPFFSSIDKEVLSSLYIHDANVTIGDGQQSVQLQEFCLKDLPDHLKDDLPFDFGFDLAASTVDFCAYIDLNMEMEGKIGRTYFLEARIEDDLLRAQTTIPGHVPFDSLRFDKAPGKPSETLLQLLTNISDPANETNYYRYFTALSDRPFRASVNSLSDDALFDGKSFEFRLNNVWTENLEISPDEFGLFRTGDTVLIKWCNLDKEHFDFWNTLQYNDVNQGPFSSYTRIKSNIEGGLGIWGGYSCSIYELVVQTE